MYKYKNMNPYNRNIEDCVIRSLSLLTDKEWDDTYRELAYYSSLDGYMTDNVEFVEDYLDDRYHRECHYSKSVGEFANEHPFGKYAVTMNGEDYRKISFEGGVALVIGAEEDGISRLVLEKCDYAVSLPMTGRIESLNASVAAGIMMYRVFDSRQ